jgi:hypothetical protein
MDWWNNKSISTIKWQAFMGNKKCTQKWQNKSGRCFVLEINKQLLKRTFRRGRWRSKIMGHWYIDKKAVVRLKSSSRSYYLNNYCWFWKRKLVCFKFFRWDNNNLAIKKIWNSWKNSCFYNPIKLISRLKNIEWYY